MENEKKNLFEKDWEKELEDKSFEDLAKIIANKEDYAIPFVEMAEERIKTLSDYNEERLNEIIESEHIVRQDMENAAAKKMSGWLMFFMAGLVLSCLLWLNNAFSCLSPENYGGILPIMWNDFALRLGLSFLAGYTFISLYKCWPNAIYLTYYYTGINIALYVLMYLTNSIAIPRLFLGIIGCVLWLSYFVLSERIIARYPVEERVLYNRDKFILGTIILVPVILLVWGLYYTPSQSLSSVVEGMNLSEVNQSSYLIDESKLKEDEITDGIVIYKIPEGLKYKLINPGNGAKCYELSNDNETPDFVIRTLGQGYTGQEKIVFSDVWEQFQDSTLIDLPHEQIMNVDVEREFDHYNRRIIKYNSDGDLFWDFTLLYDMGQGKICLLNSYYRDETKAPVREIIDGIRFKQE